MSRSVKKTPIGSFTGSVSEKDDKQLWHRRFRRANRQAIHHGKEIMPHIREHSNPWSMNKDGKMFWKPIEKDYSNPYKFHQKWFRHLPLYNPQEEWEKRYKEWKRWMRK